MSDQRNSFKYLQLNIHCKDRKLLIAFIMPISGGYKSTAKRHKCLPGVSYKDMWGKSWKCVSQKEQIYRAGKWPAHLFKLHMTITHSNKNLMFEAGEPEGLGFLNVTYTLKNSEWTGMVIPFWVKIYVICFSSELNFFYWNGMHILITHFIFIWEWKTSRRNGSSISKCDTRFESVMHAHPTFMGTKL